MSESFSETVNVFDGRMLPEAGRPVGYAALWKHYELPLPAPARVAVISGKRRRIEAAEWLVLGPSYAPDETLAGHLQFALKWEGVDLAVLRWLFGAVGSEEVTTVVRQKPTGAYTRRIWFLYEWLTEEKLDVPDAGKVRSVLAVDPKQQYVAETGSLSKRHRVTNNLPGGPAFCPLVRRTAAIDRFREKRFDESARRVAGRTHPDILARAAAFLLLDDSRASFRIEGEQPAPDRALRWSQAIAQAGTIPLNVAELERLQKLVIGDARFVKLGLRKKGGFVGEHDRFTQEPLPEHISARSDDLQMLLDGMAHYAERAVDTGLDPVVVAAVVAFGFVYVHPFEDGNGRLHRWLIHHVLADAKYSPPNLIFPISSAILRRINEYKRVLESYSRPLLPHIKWKATATGNLEVLNDTADYYKYFDATAHAAFLYACVEETVEKDLPEEVKYLEAFDRFVDGVQQVVDMPKRSVDLLHKFMRQGNGTLSKRARSGEFAPLSDAEVQQFEELFRDCFDGVQQPEAPADTLARSE